MPAGNQSEVLDLSRREALSSDELGGVVRLLLGAVTAEQKQFVLTKPREALGQAGAAPKEGWDPRLSARGNRVSKQMAVLAGSTGVGGELPGMSRLDVAGGCPTAWSWARSSRGSRATRSAWRKGPATWPWR